MPTLMIRTLALLAPSRSGCKKVLRSATCSAPTAIKVARNSGFTKEEMPAVRQREQRAACAALGISDVTFLDYVDGHLEPTIALRKDIVRQIRRVQPDRIVCQSPERNWDRIGASHPDH
jgi:LmbE family N-acetylglucosaminyl deacetylase